MNGARVMYIALYLIVIGIHLWVVMTGRLRHETHMLQLNSYFNKRYITYLGKNKLKAVDLKAVISLLGYVFFVFGPFPAIAAYALIYIVLDMAKKGENEKKPLVITDRVKRLFVTEGIISFAVMAAGLFVPRWIAPLLLFAATFIAPVTVILSNLINAPVESHIRKGFVNSAVKNSISIR